LVNNLAASVVLAPLALAAALGSRSSFWSLPFAERWFEKRGGGPDKNP
jgi:hypothetical protein